MEEEVGVAISELNDNGDPFVAGTIVWDGKQLIPHGAGAENALKGEIRHGHSHPWVNAKEHPLEFLKALHRHYRNPYYNVSEVMPAAKLGKIGAVLGEEDGDSSSPPPGGEGSGGGSSGGPDRAPEGGVNIGGTFYPGGQFIPKEVMDKATPEERASLDAQ